MISAARTLHQAGHLGAEARGARHMARVAACARQDRACTHRPQACSQLMLGGTGGAPQWLRTLRERAYWPSRTKHVTNSEPMKVSAFRCEPTECAPTMPAADTAATTAASWELCIRANQVRREHGNTESARRGHICGERRRLAPQASDMIPRKHAPSVAAHSLPTPPVKRGAADAA